MSASPTRKRRPSALAELLLAGAAVSSLASCRSVAVEPQIARSHVIMFDEYGDAIDPGDLGGGFVASYANLDEEHARVHVETMLKAIQASGHERVVFFIHGGINTQVESIERALKLSPVIEESGAYPIFINWKSSLTSSYFEHLFRVRQGEHRPFLGFITFPIPLAADLVRAVVRLPVVGAMQTWEWAQSTLPLIPMSINRKHALESVHALVDESNAGRDDAFEFSIGSDFDDKGNLGLGTIWSIAMAPLRVVSIFFVDAFGPPSWSVMERHVNLMFAPEIERPRGRVDPPFNELDAVMLGLARMQRDGVIRDVSLVGHSTGTIIVNRILDAALARPPLTAARDTVSVGSPPYPLFSDLVYLGAACSIEQYQASAWAYLRRTAVVEGELRPNVYHVMLHPDAEMNECHVLDISPRGSLLVWLDDFVASPVSELDRVAGRFDNFMQSLHNTPRDLRSRIHVRVCDEMVYGSPREHSQFSSPRPTDFRFKFWDRESWRGPKGEAIPESP